MHKTTHNPIAIIGAMPQEIETLIAKIVNAEEITIAGITMTRGKINDTHVVIQQCGIGKVNAAIGTALLIEKFSPRAVINTGSAGGIGSGLAIGDIVIGTTTCHHDVDLTAFGYVFGQMAQMPESYTSDPQIVATVTKYAHYSHDSNIYQGQIVSGDQFISDTKHFASIKSNFPDAVAVEMEAAAIAQTCFRFNVPFVVVRAISDMANESASVSFDEFIETAGRKSAEMIIQVLKHLE